MKILVIHNDQDAAYRIKQIVTRRVSGIEDDAVLCHIIENPGDAARLPVSEDTKLIVTDYLMPGKSGIAVLREYASITGIIVTRASSISERPSSNCVRIICGIDFEEELSETIRVCIDKGFELDQIKHRLSAHSLLYEHTYDILSAFLALDIELQVAGNQERCRKEVEIFLSHKDAVEQYLRMIESLIDGQDEVSEFFGSSQMHLNHLVEQISRLRDVLREGFEDVRGKAFNDFHKKYEELRDSLFRIVSAFEL